MAITSIVSTFISTRRAAILPVPLTAMSPSEAIAQNWPRFRGENGLGQCDDVSIALPWSNTWQAQLPGTGNSSPIVWADRVFIQSANSNDATQFVSCHRAGTGDKIWHREFASQPYPIHARNTFASSTPAADAQHVYLCYGTPDNITLLALNHDGEDVWRRDIGPFASQHGFGVSPMVYGDLVVLAGQQLEAGRENSAVSGPDVDAASRPEGSYIMAVDRLTGNTRWITPRGGDKASYSVPCVFAPEGAPPQLICCNTIQGMFALSPSDGHELWAHPVFDKRTVSSPLLVGDFVLGTCGSGGGGNYLVACRPAAGGTESYRVENQAPYVPTPVASGNLVFLWSDRGVVSCVDVQTGEAIWRERVGGNYSSSPVRVGQQLVGVSEDGRVVVLSATREFARIMEKDLGEPTRATPAIASGKIYFRTDTQLLAVALQATK
ncbi:MAG: PQQ-binding-like beta-propeller repeat protein [Planctomycetales bacterium]|nr:PQQ-binding-like beta-propeller repeat protein [Planctomycetales bacterium]